MMNVAYVSAVLMVLLHSVLVSCASPKNLCARGVVIPVYEGHYHYLNRLLSSLNLVNDISSVAFHLVTSNQQESRHVTHLLQQFPFHSSFVVSDIFYLLTYFGELVELPENKISYQTIKKLYGLRYLNCSQMLWADAEMVLLRPVNFSLIFQNYFKAPFIFFDDVMGAPFNDVSRAGLWLLQVNVTLLRKFSTMGYQAWFVERDIIHDLFTYLTRRGTPAALMRQGPQPQFETFILYYFIFLHTQKYPTYRFVPFVEVISFYLQEHSLTYLQPHVKDQKYPQGIECMLNHVPISAATNFVHFLHDFHVVFFRFDCISNEVRRNVLPYLMQNSELSIQVCSSSVYNTTLAPK